jgi:hypothetical protein
MSWRKKKRAELGGFAPSIGGLAPCAFFFDVGLGSFAQCAFFFGVGLGSFAPCLGGLSLLGIALDFSLGSLAHSFGLLLFEDSNDSEFQKRSFHR